MPERETIDEITSRQMEAQEKSRAIPEGGTKVEHLGQEFIVNRNVFMPYSDTEPLIENYTVNPGETVLDVCTGCGNIAVVSAQKGAKKVVALDILPEAVETAKANAKLHGVEDIIEVKPSDMFEALIEDDKFDVITASLPFRRKRAKDGIEAAFWDTDFETNKKFFAGVSKHFNQGGRIYISQANYGDVEEMKKLAFEAGFNVRLIGEKKMPQGDPRIFYAFELTRKE